MTIPSPQQPASRSSWTRTRTASALAAMVMLSSAANAQAQQAPAAAGSAPQPLRDAHQAHVEWGYVGPSGPDHWAQLGETYGVCANGQQESPIDLRSAMPAQLKPLRVQWNPSPLKVTNNGHTLQASMSAGGTLTLEGRTYKLMQFHLHHPSEHLLNGRRFPLELHFVHQGPDGVLGVIGVFVEQGSHNPTLQKVLDRAPQEAGGERVEPNQQLDPAALLPTGGYFRYEGSLTTPPCSENVDWIVMSRPIKASAAQIETFSKLFPMNARPIQSLNRRFLLVKP